jgi:hypothetical protein
MLTATPAPRIIERPPIVGPMYVDYVGLQVTDLSNSLRFFTKGLGPQELRRGKMFHGGIWVLL